MNGYIVGLGVAVSLVLPLWGCGKKADDSEATPATAEAKAAPKPAKAAAALPFCVMAVRVEVAAHPATGLSPTLLREPVAEMLAGLPHVIGLDKGGPAEGAGCGKAAKREQQVGVMLQVVASLRDAAGKDVATTEKAGPGELHVKVTAHAERGDADGRPEIGLGSMQAAVPVTERHVPQLPRFTSVRVVRAAALAASDALGQLAVRHVDDATVAAFLNSETAWKRIGAVREVGERGLEDKLDAVHEAARSSRKDIALVAIATIGRLGKPASIDLLIRALDRPAIAVIDAALVALADIGGTKANDAVSSVATSHPSPWVRRRAKSLLNGAGN